MQEEQTHDGFGEHRVPYNEKAVEAFEPVAAQLAALRLPLIRQRRYNGIANAIEMQIEDGPIRKTVLAHLRAALLALAEADKIDADQVRGIATAFDRFEAQI